MINGELLNSLSSAELNEISVVIELSDGSPRAFSSNELALAYLDDNKVAYELASEAALSFSRKGTFPAINMPEYVNVFQFEAIEDYLNELNG